MHLIDQAPHPQQFVFDGREVLQLALFNLVGPPPDPRIEEKQRVVQFVQPGFVHHHAVDGNPLPALKLDQIQSPMRCEHLILAPDALAQDGAFDVNRQTSQLGLGHKPPLVSVNRVQQSDGKARRRAQAGERRQVRGEPDLHVAFDAAQFQHLTKRTVLDIGDRADRFDFAVSQADRVVEQVRGELGDRMIDALVDGGPQHGTAIPFEVLRKVRAAAEEADPERRSANDHRAGLDGESAAKTVSWFARNHSTVAGKPCSSVRG